MLFYYLSNIIVKKGPWNVLHKIQFFSSLPLFARSSRRTISTLAYHFKILNISRNHVLFKEGDEADQIFIVKSGEIKITKDIDMKIQEDIFKKEETFKPKINSKKTLEVHKKPNIIVV